MLSSSCLTLNSSSSDCRLRASSSSAVPAGIPCSSHFSRSTLDCGNEEEETRYPFQSEASPSAEPGFSCAPDQPSPDSAFASLTCLPTPLWPNPQRATRGIYFCLSYYKKRKTYGKTEETIMNAHVTSSSFNSYKNLAKSMYFSPKAL